MWSRISPLSRCLALKSMPRFTVSRAHDSYYCQPHMNELPVACHPWDEHYLHRQKAYNKVLIGGILWFLFSAFMMLATNSLQLNCSPPKVPTPPTPMDECGND